MMGGRFLRIVLATVGTSLFVFMLLDLFRRSWKKLIGRTSTESGTTTTTTTDVNLEAGVEDSVDGPRTYFCHDEGTCVDSVVSAVREEIDRDTSSTRQHLSGNFEQSEREDMEAAAAVSRGETDISSTEGHLLKSDVSIQTSSFENASNETASTFNFSLCSNSMVYADSMMYGDSMAYNTSAMESSEAMDKETSTPMSKSTPESCKKNRIRSQLQLPREVIGRFIGKQGRNIKALMQESGGAYVYLNQKSVPIDALIVPCTIQGTLKQVNEALAIIERKYPEISISEALVNPDPTPFAQRRVPLFPTPPCGMVPTESIPLESWEYEVGPASIPENSFSATVTFIESMSHVWIASVNACKEMDILGQSMSYTYNSGSTAKHCPPMPADNQTDMIGKFCAVKVSKIHWLRGRIVRYGEDLLSYEVQLVDYGSNVMVSAAALNPLGKEYCKLPALAFKAQLAHVQATNEDSHEGLAAMQQMMENTELEIHVTGKVPFNLSADKKEKDGSAWIKSLSSSSSAAKPAIVSPAEVADGATELEKRSIEVTPKSACISETSLTSEQSTCNGDSGVLSLSTKSLEYSPPASSQGEPMVLPNSHPNGSVSNTSKEPLSGSFKTKRASIPNDDGTEGGLQDEESFSIGPLPGPSQESTPSGCGDEASSSFLDCGGGACSMREPVAKSVLANGVKPKSPLMLEEVEMSYHNLPDLAPYVPVVEIYTRVGAQKPIFVNRELVELGHAIWIEEKYMS